MDANFHPMLVHFPVALFTIYALIELARIIPFFRAGHWTYVKAVMVSVGAAGGVAAATAGLMIKDRIGATPNTVALIAKHQTFAVSTLVMFSVIALAYLIRWIKQDAPGFVERRKLAGLVRLSDTLLKAPIIIPLAFIGLALVTITGALGGAIAYGPDIDPAVSMICGVIGC